MFDQAPSFVLIGLVAASALVGVVFALLASQPLLFVGGPIVVFGYAHFQLLKRQRQFLARASAELVPFLRRIEASVRAGRAAPLAYRQAVLETKTLQRVLMHSADEMAAGATFVEALRGTVHRLPLRMWFVFVRQMEIHEEAGGRLSESLGQTVQQINVMLQLQAQARADYATQARQQNLIVVIVFGALIFFAVAVSPNAVAQLWQTGIGIIASIVGLSLIGGGLWFGRKQLRDIDRRLNF